MKLKHRNVAFHVKEISDEGEFSGHASVFEVVDWYRDIVMPGAFEESLATWKKKDSLPPVLWQHMSTMPIGPHTLMREDSKGLYVEGRLMISPAEENPEARKAHALMKAKVIRGMSIGYDIGEGGLTYFKEENTYHLTKLDLWENSIVTFPANTEAMVENVKSILRDGTLPSLSDFEDYLRDAGFSKKQAVTIASHGLKALLRRDSEGERSDSAAIAKAFDPIRNYLEGK